MKFAILAAGEGSRLAEEGIDVPKPLVEINGEPLLHRLIRIFMMCDAEEIYVITNDLAPYTERALQSLAAAGLPVKYIVKTTPSSMHSFYELHTLLGKGKFCLTTVDTIFREEEFRAFIRDFEQSEEDGLMAVTDYIDDEKPLYISTDSEMCINGFHDTLQQYEEALPLLGASTECKYISGGIYCLSDKAFPTLERCVENGQSRMRNFQRALVADGLCLKACVFSKILDVDHAEDIIKAEKFLAE